jgi:hypothetical protein
MSRFAHAATLAGCGDIHANVYRDRRRLRGG